MNRTLSSVNARKKSVKVQMRRPLDYLTCQRWCPILLVTLMTMVLNGVRAVNMIDMAYSSDTRVSSFENFYMNELENSKASGEKNHNDLNFHKQPLPTKDFTIDLTEEHQADPSMLERFVTLASDSLAQVGLNLLTTFDTLKNFIS